MLLVSGSQDRLSLGCDLGCSAVMDHRRGHQAKTAMSVIVVVPVEKGACPSPSIRDTTEAVWIARSIFHRLELGLGKRIVAGGVGSGVGLGDTQIRQQLSNRLGCH